MNTIYLTGKPVARPYGISKEKLNDNSTYLISFYFHQGGNVYVFRYEKENTIKYTLVDAGDLYYQDHIFTIFAENEINPVNIERIILTHRHTDHVGLAAILAKESQSEIIAHSNFRNFIEGDMSIMERRWFGEFDTMGLKKCDIKYLYESESKEVRDIGGVKFKSLVEPVEIGEAGHLEILAVPENIMSHTPDQVLVLYIPKTSQPNDMRRLDGMLINHILFSGDLWLMTGPSYHRGVRHISRHLRMYAFRLKNLLSVGGIRRQDHREQDAETKEALKRGFSLIRVKPGHGDEFIGSRIIPNGLLADRDILVKLGYSEDTSKSILKKKDLSGKIAAIKEKAYTSFIKELHYWLESGYNPNEVSSLLVRIYKEQSGGIRQVRKDRKERRRRLKATLVRLKSDGAVSDELHELAESTLTALNAMK